MKLKFTLRSTLLTLATITISGHGMAQCTQANAVSDITLQCSGAGNTRTGVAYYPTKNMYYSVVAGTTNYFIETFAGTGGTALSSTVQVGDYRGLWYNALLGTIEGNTFSGVGIFQHDIDPATGYAAGTATNLLLGAMPNSQSCGAYDPTMDQVLYYNGGTLYKYSRSTGLQVTSMAITGLPAGNINIYSLGYTGVSGREVCLYDYTNQMVRFINYSTGAYVSSCQLPATAPVPGSYRMGYANNRIFLYDQPLQRWYGYKVTDQPDIVFTGNNIICDGQTLNLMASGGASYLWNNGFTTPILTVSPGTNTMYAVVATNTAGCTSASNFFIIVNPSPTVTAVSTNTLFCNPGTATLTASGASNYTWSTGPATAATTVAPSVSTTYTVIGDMNGCSNTAVVSILVESDPVVNVASSNSMICAGGIATLTASGADSYTWSIGGGFGPTLIVNPTVYTTYTVTGSSANGCTGFANVDTISVGVSPNLTVSASADYSVICPGFIVNLTALGATSYTWTGSTFSMPIMNSTIAVSPTANSSYTVFGTSQLGCISNFAVVNITTVSCTGLEETLAGEDLLSAYPNPNNGTFTLKSTARASLSLVNSLGQTVQTIYLNEHNGYTGEVSGLADGIYFIVSPRGASSNAKKIVVTH